MDDSKDTLYIFLHIPKCAGSTFEYHIRNNFKKEEIIELNESFIAPYLQGKSIAFLSYKEKNKIKKQCFEKFKNYIDELSDDQKNRIKVIYGHYVFYGIHTFLNKNPRYVTFIRNPISMILSAYNFLVLNYYRGILEKHFEAFIL